MLAREGNGELQVDFAFALKWLDAQATIVADLADNIIVVIDGLGELFGHGAPADAIAADAIAADDGSGDQGSGGGVAQGASGLGAGARSGSC